MWRIIIVVSIALCIVTLIVDGISAGLYAITGSPSVLIGDLRVQRTLDGLDSKQTFYSDGNWNTTGTFTITNSSPFDATGLRYDCKVNFIGTDEMDENDGTGFTPDGMVFHAHSHTTFTIPISMVMDHADHLHSTDSKCTLSYR